MSLGDDEIMRPNTEGAVGLTINRLDVVGHWFDQSSFHLCNVIFFRLTSSYS